MGTDAAGVDLGFSGVHTNLDAIARLGQLYLDDGVWDGHRLLPDGWVAAASSPQIANPRVTNPTAAGLGFQLWMSQHGSERAHSGGSAADAPRDQRPSSRSYDFPTKTDLVSDVLRALGERLQGVLATAFDAPAADHLVARQAAAWLDPCADERAIRCSPCSSRRTGSPLQDASRTVDLVVELVEAWTEWLAGFLSGSGSRRRSQAAATVALVDGLLLLRQISGADAANRAVGAALHVIGARPSAGLGDVP